MKTVLRRLHALLLILVFLLPGCASEHPEPEQVMEPVPAETILHEPAAAPAADEADDLLRKRRKSDDSDDMERQD